MRRLFKLGAFAVALAISVAAYQLQTVAHASMHATSSALQAGADTVLAANRPSSFYPITLPDGFVLDTATTLSASNCASGGTSIGTSEEYTRYWVRTFDEDVWLCYAATCAAGGVRLAPGSSVLLLFRSAQALSCRSTSSTGDIEGVEVTN